MKKVFLLITASALFVNCKRHETFGDIEPNTDRVMAEFTDAATGTTINPAFSADFIEVDLTELRLSPRTVTNHETKVKVTVNPVVVSQYNSANGTTYVPAGASGFSLVQTEYTLRPSQRSTKVRGVLRPGALIDNNYAIGLSISEMSDGDISAVAKHVIVFVSIKNQYDGIYSLKGFSNIPGSPYNGNFSLPCTEELEVPTSGSNSVYLSPSQPVYNNGAFTFITNLLPDFTIDNATNRITAVTPRSGSLDLIFPFDAGYNSRYDPATKTIYVKYGIAPAGSGRYIIDTLTYCKAR